MNRSLIIFTLFIFTSASVFAQKTNSKTKLDEDGTSVLVDLEGDGPPPIKGYRSQLNIEVSSPHMFFNPAGSQAFNGIVQANIWYSAKIVKNFSLGPYFKYTGFEYYAGRNNQASPLITQLSSGLQMSYEVKLGDRFAYIPAVFLGVGYIQYDNLSIPGKGVEDVRNKVTDWAFSAQTNQSFYYYCTENHKIAVGLVLGLSFNTHQFKLKDTGLNSDASLLNFSDNGPTLYGNVGFALLMNFGRIK